MAFTDTVFNWLPKLRKPDTTLADAQCDSAGRLLVAIGASTLASTTWIDPAAGTPLTYQRVAASTAKKLWSAYGANEGASTRWMMIFDRATLATLAAEPTFSFAVPAGQPFSFTLNRARQFSAGIVWGVSSTASTFTADTGALFRVNLEVE